MTQASRRPRRAALLAGATALAMATLATSSCSMFDQSVPPPCPSVSVLGDASRITKFVDGPGRDLIDVRYEAQIADAAGSCTYDVDKDTRAGKLDVEMTVVMDLSRGPADREGQAQINYFVALLGKDQAILNKQHFNATVAFPPNTSKLAWQDEPVYLSIPLAAGQTGRDFQIFVGYDLTQEEVRFNRKQTREVRP